MLACSLLVAVMLFVLAGLSFEIAKFTGVIVGMFFILLASVAYLVLTKKFCAQLDEAEKAALRGSALPSVDADLEEKACIPVVGGLFGNKEKSAQNES